MELSQHYRKVRAHTEALVAGLETEDMVVQVDPDVSPPKWHLGHTTWFFEKLVLVPRGVAPFDEVFERLFNSYYESLGAFWPQGERGKLSRPTVDRVRAWRHHVDRGMEVFFREQPTPSELAMVELGLHHEQQHQELLLMDIKLNFFRQRQGLRYLAGTPATPAPAPGDERRFEGGLVEVGHGTSAFAYDNESPRHRVYLAPYMLKTRLETNGEYREFVEAGGYREPEYWLSDGWAFVRRERLEHPLYWSKGAGGWTEYTLHGEVPLDPHAPVAHLSYYEAAAYARFRGKRLPTEFEWEHAAHVAGDATCGPLWQWTSSDYAPYPGHVRGKGPLGEYNAKFMANQKVLRGGSFATPAGHYRTTYRNYFYPDKRWPFTGVRLAGEAT